MCPYRKKNLYEGNKVKPESLHPEAKLTEFFIDSITDSSTQIWEIKPTSRKVEICITNAKRFLELSTF